MAKIYGIYNWDTESYEDEFFAKESSAKKFIQDQQDPNSHFTTNAHLQVHEIEVKED